MSSQSKIPIVVVGLSLIGAVGIGPVQGESQEGPGSGAAYRPALTFGLSDGVLQVTLPEDWEANPRLKDDNQAVGFLHPKGQIEGVDIPVWVLLEWKARSVAAAFNLFVRQCLKDGASYGFFQEDSSVVATADGRDLYTFRFNRSTDGEERGLGILETPKGAILFRYQARDSLEWSENEAKIDEILRGVRFLSRQGR